MENPAISGNNSVNITNSYYDSSVTPADYSGMSREDRTVAFAEAVLERGLPTELAAAAYGMQYGQDIADAAKEIISNNDSIPTAQQDIIIDAIDHQMSTTQLNTSPEVKSMMELAKEFMADMAKEDMDDANAQAGGGSEEGVGGKGGGKGGAGNWLVQLASAMGKVAGAHLEKMVETANSIANIEGSGGATKELAAQGEGESDNDFEARKINHLSEADAVDGKQAAEMTKLTAEMQAHTQMFKMAQEATTTAVKTVGEAINGTVRKQ